MLKLRIINIIKKQLALISNISQENINNNDNNNL